MKKFLSLIALILTISVGAFAQAADSTGVSYPAITDTLGGNIAGIVNAFPNVAEYCKVWLPVVLIVLLSAKATVKAIPTKEPIKVAGRLDWILNLLTAFQKDIRIKSVVFFIGISFAMSSCSFTQAVASKCKVTGVVMTGETQKACIECNGLPNYILKLVNLQ